VCYKLLTGCGGSVSLLVRPRFTLLYFTVYFSDLGYVLRSTLLYFMTTLTLARFTLLYFTLLAEVDTCLVE
jgi:hypothetical protein